MKLVVGLGNPGSRYRDTRHNLGFEVLEALADRQSAASWRRRWEAELAEVAISAQKTLLMAPQTFMNCSGRSVRQAVDFFQLPLEDLLVVCDDIALPLGKVRLRKAGSAGGHNGLKDIITSLATGEFARLRIGVGGPPEHFDAAEWVLSRFANAERPIVEDSVNHAADAVEHWVSHGIEAAMNQFN